MELFSFLQRVEISMMKRYLILIFNRNFQKYYDHTFTMYYFTMIKLTAQVKRKKKNEHQIKLTDLIKNIC